MIDRSGATTRPAGLLRTTTALASLAAFAGAFAPEAALPETVPAQTLLSYSLVRQGPTGTPGVKGKDADIFGNDANDGGPGGGGAAGPRVELSFAPGSVVTGAGNPSFLVRGAGGNGGRGGNGGQIALGGFSNGGDGGNGGQGSDLAIVQAGGSISGASGNAAVIETLGEAGGTGARPAAMARAQTAAT